MAANPPKHRQLPDKEAKLFKELLTQYELRQYKKGLKAADTILKKFPNHGETLALKALTLHSSLPFPATVTSLPKQEEAETLSRLAVKKDITSHITWHVLGILAKTRKDWEEASRAFAMARKQDNDNIPLIRDSISLYLHTRQYGQAVAARHHHLLLRPQLRSSWLGLMIAHELNGDTDEALEVYDALMACIKNDGATASEKAQLLLFVVKICVDAGKVEKGLQRLEAGLQDGVLSQRGEVTQLKAEILFKLDRTHEAEDTYRALLEQNPDNLDYYRGFLRVKGLDITRPLDADETPKVLHALDLFAESYPKSAAPRRMGLDLVDGDAFRQRARTYIVNGLERGIPSLFVDVKGVYANAARMKIVGEIMEDIIATLEKDASLHGDDSTAPPTALLWAYYYHALHLSHPLHPNPSASRSLDLISKAHNHTPTLPEVYMAQAMVLKRAGDPLGAAQAMEEARLLDGQDRFLNSKAVKYWLRAGEIKKAEELAAMFTKKDIPVVTDLVDLQCNWFLQEEADAYKRNGNLAMALKRYHNLFTIFQDYEDDQYDFHTYCMRRMTFSSYLAMMRYEDQLRSHPAYFHAAIQAIEIYTRIHDDPGLTEEKLTPDEEADRKRAAKKAQKAEQKARKAALASGDGKKEEQPVPDEDPDGTKLLKTETPLDDALKAWRALEKMASTRIEVWTAGYEILIRKKMFLAALRCLLSATELDAEDPRLHSQIIHFRRTVSNEKELPTSITAVIEAAFTPLLPTSTTLDIFNLSYLSRHPTSSPHILGAAKGLFEVKRSSDSFSSDTPESIANFLSKLTEENVQPRLSDMLDGKYLLKQAGASAQVLTEFSAKCQKRLPVSTIFAPEAERKRKREEVMESQPNGVVNGKTDV